MISVSIEQEHWVTSGDLLLYARVEGNPQATPLVLVHGYPDNHSVWDRVTEQLKKDYLVVRYDVRGAGRSDKPARTSAYRMKWLAQDLKAVANAVIPDRSFHLVAHDWGSIQSWETVTTGALDGRIRSYTAISGPCLDHVGYWFRDQIMAPRSGGTTKVLKQLASSWYVFMFQLPVLPETLWKAGLDRLWPGYLRKHEQIADAQFSEYQKAATRTATGRLPGAGDHPHPGRLCGPPTHREPGPLDRQADLAGTGYHALGSHHRAGGRVTVGTGICRSPSLIWATPNRVGGGVVTRAHRPLESLPHFYLFF